MMLKFRILTCFFLLFFVSSFGQMQQYRYKRELKGVKNAWHKLTLPNDIFEKVSPDVSDLRVFGISDKNDTIEASYLLQVKNEKHIKTTVDFKILNTSYNEKGSYFTLEVPNQEPINQLQLDFKQFNFDWRILLEGSHNQKEWFTIVDDYRVLSIKNAATSFDYTHITFPNSRYRYFRILIKSNEKTELKLVKASNIKIEKGVFNEYAIKSMAVQEKKQDKITDIDIELSECVPVSYLKMDVNAGYDYYRPITIKYVSDSIKTKKGYVYSYKTLTHATLNSIEKNEFLFENTIIKKLKISIDNQDNQPLKINNVTVKGNVYEVSMRFTEPATYFLTYGNSEAQKPNYDIERFISKASDTITDLTLGKEQIIYKKSATSKRALFENKIWLWGIIILIIGLLGWFSIKMIKSKENAS